MLFTLPMATGAVTEGQSEDIKEYYKLEGDYTVLSGANEALLSEFGDVDFYETDRYIISYTDASILNDLTKNYTILRKFSEKNMVAIKTADHQKFREFKEELLAKTYANKIAFVQPDYSMNLSADEPEENENSSGELLQVPSTNSTEKATSEDDNLTKDKTSEESVADETASNGENEEQPIAEGEVADKISEETIEPQKNNTTIIALLDTYVDINNDAFKDYIATDLLSKEDAQRDFTKGQDDSNWQSTISTEWHGNMVAEQVARGIGNSPAKILPLTVFYNAMGYTSDIIAAILYAESIGVDYINASFESAYQNPALEKIIKNSNITYVTAAGNGAKDLDENAIYPACIDSNNVKVVTSCNQEGKLSSFANFGNKVNYIAPGEDLESVITNNLYKGVRGTSASTAYICGKLASGMNMSEYAYTKQNISAEKEQSASINIDNEVTVNQKQNEETELNTENSPVNSLAPLSVADTTIRASSSVRNGWNAIESMGNNTYYIASNINGAYMICGSNIWYFEESLNSWMSYPSNVTITGTTVYGGDDENLYYIKSNQLYRMYLNEGGWENEALATLPASLQNQSDISMVYSTSANGLFLSQGTNIYQYANHAFSKRNNAPVSNGKLLSVCKGAQNIRGLYIYGNSNLYAYDVNAGWYVIASVSGTNNSVVSNGYEIYSMGNRHYIFNPSTGNIETIVMDTNTYVLNGPSKTFQPYLSMTQGRYNPITGYTPTGDLIVMGGKADGDTYSAGERLHIVHDDFPDTPWDYTTITSYNANAIPTNQKGYINATNDTDAFTIKPSDYNNVLSFGQAYNIKVSIYDMSNHLVITKSSSTTAASDFEIPLSLNANQTYTVNIENGTGTANLGWYEKVMLQHPVTDIQNPTDLTITASAGETVDVALMNTLDNNQKEYTIHYDATKLELVDASLATPVKETVGFTGRMTDGVIAQSICAGTIVIRAQNFYDFSVKKVITMMRFQAKSSATSTMSLEGNEVK